MSLITKMLSHWLTARDGESFSLTKLAFIVAMVTMAYRFATDIATPDYIAFAGGVAALISALAIKYHVETPEKTDSKDVNITGGAP